MENQENNTDLLNSNDKPALGYQILAFVIPIAGLIMAYNNRKDFPLKAKRYKILAVIAISIGLFFRIIDRL
jgi:hypothetical protein